MRSYDVAYEGVIPNLQRRYEATSSDYVREEIERYMAARPCPACKGARLKPEVLAVTVGERSIVDVTRMPIREAQDWFAVLARDPAEDPTAPLTEREFLIARQILKEIRERLGFLVDVGLDYLTLERSANTLSGGEAQRIRLATQIGSSLMGVLYILDEPSIGLHQRDNARLIRTLERLRDIGNTLIVVEHDEETMRAADWIIDIGPGAGEHGGHIVAEGTMDDIARTPESITGQYLTGERADPDAGHAAHGQRQGARPARGAREQPRRRDRPVPAGDVHRASPASPARARARSSPTRSTRGWPWSCTTRGRNRARTTIWRGSSTSTR